MLISRKHDAFEQKKSTMTHHHPMKKCNQFVYFVIKSHDYYRRCQFKPFVPYMIVPEKKKQVLFMSIRVFYTLYFNQENTNCLSPGIANPDLKYKRQAH